VGWDKANVILQWIEAKQWLEMKLVWAFYF
jgi:hypothetical protein